VLCAWLIANQNRAGEKEVSSLAHVDWTQVYSGSSSRVKLFVKSDMWRPGTAKFSVHANVCLVFLWILGFDFPHAVGLKLAASFVPDELWECDSDSDRTIVCFRITSCSTSCLRLWG
jgi:hypothetical protein